MKLSWGIYKSSEGQSRLCLLEKAFLSLSCPPSSMCGAGLSGDSLHKHLDYFFWRCLIRGETWRTLTLWITSSVAVLYSRGSGADVPWTYTTSVGTGRTRTARWTELPSPIHPWSTDGGAVIPNESWYWDGGGMEWAGGTWSWREVNFHKPWALMFPRLRNAGGPAPLLPRQHDNPYVRIPTPAPTEYFKIWSHTMQSISFWGCLELLFSPPFPGCLLYSLHDPPLTHSLPGLLNS